MFNFILIISKYKEFINIIWQWARVFKSVNYQNITIYSQENTGMSNKLNREITDHKKESRKVKLVL